MMFSSAPRRRGARPSSSFSSSSGYSARGIFQHVASRGVALIVVVGCLLHLVNFVSIFDIHFKSPIVNGMTPHAVQHEAPAKRLVLFLADGLRADTTFELKPDFYSDADRDKLGPGYNYSTPISVAPFLRSIVEEEGRWGVSHCHVPTESRPGHASVLAGIYEDPSAVFEGWNVNYVHFDTIFNESSHTWAIGSGGILKTFGAGLPHVKLYYPTKSDDPKDFAANVHGDAFVERRTNWLFEQARNNATFDAILREPQTVYFVYFVSSDRYGHFFRGDSMEYRRNVKSIDAKVKRLTKGFQDFYGDEKTAFMFTSDHGMSDKGSHGDGDPLNTRTPFVAWGAGIDTPKKMRSGRRFTPDPLSRTWHLDQLERLDMEQADEVTLMAALLGVPYPMNSVGRLPIDYIDPKMTQFRARAIFANMLQLLELYLTKARTKTEETFLFQSFRPLDRYKERLDELVGMMRGSGAGGSDISSLAEVEVACTEMMEVITDGLRYLQKYDWAFLMFTVTMGYLGWIVYLILFLVKNYTEWGHSVNFDIRGDREKVMRSDASHDDMAGAQRRRKSDKAGSGTSTHDAIGLGVLLSVYFFLFLESRPFVFYLYTLFPVYLWSEVLKRKALLLVVYRRLSAARETREYASYFLGGSFVYLEILVASYVYREIYTVLLFLFALRPYVLGRQARTTTSSCAPAGSLARNSGPIWSVACVLAAGFPLLATEYHTNMNIFGCGGAVITIGLTFYGLKSLRARSRSRGFSPLSIAIFMGVCCMASMWTAFNTFHHLKNKENPHLPFPNQVFTWFVAVAAPVVSAFSSPNYMHRLVAVLSGFGLSFYLLCISFEPFFYIVLSLLLIAWVGLEVMVETSTATEKRTSLPASSEGSGSSGGGESNMSNFVPMPDATPGRVSNNGAHVLTMRHVFNALFYLFLANLAFFGTGNIASISSFQISSAFRFVTKFHPFLLTVLLVWKIIVPNMVVSFAFFIIMRSQKAPFVATLACVLIMADVMCLNFFWMVTGEGSWMDIGMSIGQFGVYSMIVLMILVTSAVSLMLSSDISFRPSESSASPSSPPPVYRLR